MSPKNNIFFHKFKDNILQVIVVKFRIIICLVCHTNWISIGRRISWALQTEIASRNPRTISKITLKQTKINNTHMKLYSGVPVSVVYNYTFVSILSYVYAPPCAPTVHEHLTHGPTSSVTPPYAISLQTAPAQRKNVWYPGQQDMKGKQFYNLSRDELQPQKANLFL